MADTKYVATQQLFIGRYTLAHNPGDDVPADNVERNGWQDGVAKAGTKAALKAQGVDEPDDTPAAPASAVKK